MSRTIEEIQGYFEERPELKKRIKDFNYPLSIEDMSTDSIIDAMSRMDSCDFRGDIIPGLSKQKEIENFKKWIIGDKKEEHIVGYKGFKYDLTCLGFQYEIGKEYENNKIIWACENGFHACQSPLEVLRYYAGFSDRYCIVEQWGYIDERDVKRASSNIKIVKEITIRELFEAAEKRLKPIDGSNMRVVGEGQICRYVSLSTSLAIDGVRSNIILHRCFQNTQLRENKTIMGVENIIGIMDDMFTINVLGDGNLIYVFGNGIIINVTGDMNRVEIIGGKDCNVIVTGNYNRVQTRSKVNVTCIGHNNDVDAGVDSRVNLIDGEDIMSSVVKDIDIKIQLV